MNYSRNLTESDLVSNYDIFIDFLRSTFSGDRLEKLMIMYSEDELGQRVTLTPASGKLNFHLAHPGGYLQHIMNVVNASKGYEKLYGFMGGTIDYTNEERIFAAVHHDLGKLGDETGEYYLRQTSDWHQKKRGEVYKHNPELQYMDVTDRSIYLLQKYQINYNWKEMLGIKLADGLYNKANEAYFMSYNPAYTMKTNLPHIIHGGDYIACRTEYDMWRKEFPDVLLTSEA
jgi:hypothetical protein